MPKDLFGNEIEEERTLMLDGTEHTIITPSSGPKNLKGGLSGLPFGPDGKATRDRSPVYFGSGGAYVFITPDLVMVLSPRALANTSQAYITLLSVVNHALDTGTMTFGESE